MLILKFLCILALFSKIAWASATLPVQIQGTDLFSGKDLNFKINQPTKATVLVFLSARCPCSASHETTLIKLFEDFSNQGFQFIGVHSNTDESLELTQAHFQESDESKKDKRPRLPFPILQDPKAQIADEWDALATPHVFVISPQGEILYQGGVDSSTKSERAKEHFLQDALVAIRDGLKPKISQARSIGCFIKR